MAGYPLLTEVVEGTTYWKLESSFKGVPPVTFTLNELMALYFSRKLIVSPGGSPFRADLESAFKKIESALSAKHVARLEKIYPSKMRKGLGRHVRKDDAEERFCRGRKVYRRGHRNRKIKTVFGFLDMRVRKAECLTCGSRYSPFLNVYSERSGVV